MTFVWSCVRTNISERNLSYCLVCPSSWMYDKADEWLVNNQRSNGPRREKTCLRGLTNNKGTDQPAHPRSLISAFVIRFLKSTVFNLATGQLKFLASLCS